MGNIRNNIMIVDVDPLKDMPEETTWLTEKKVAERALAPVYLQWRKVNILRLIPFSVHKRSRWQ